MSFIRRDAPIIILFLVGAIMISAYFVPASTVPVIKLAENELNTWGIILSNFLYFVGAVSLFLLHFSRIRTRTKGWPFSTWTIVVMVVFIIIGTTIGQSSELYRKLYGSTVLPISATMWLVMCLFMISSAYTSFRVRSLNASVLLVACILVMLKNAPIGEAIWSGFGALGTWISDYPVTGGTRAFLICAAIGALVLGFRTLFGYERTHFGREER